MTRKSINIGYSILAFLYPFITVLPIYFLLETTLLMVLVPFILLFLVMPSYRGYIKDHLFEFEDRGSALSGIVTISSILLTVAINIIIIKSKIPALLAVIPTVTILVFAYIFTVFDFIESSSDSMVIKIRYNHLLNVESILKSFMTIKVILVIVFTFYSSVPLKLLWIIGFALDLAVMVNIRNRLHDLIACQNGTFTVKNSPFRAIWVSFILLFSLFIALITSRDFSLLPYRYILRFIEWLNGLAPGGTVEAPTIPNGSVESSGQGLDFSQLGESEPTSAFLQSLWMILEKIFTGLFVTAIVMALIYFVFYPLLSPLLNRDRERVTFLDYYKKIWDKVIKFFEELKEAILAIFSAPEDNFETVAIKNTTASKKPVRRDKGEIRYIHRQYLKVVKWSIKKEYTRKNSNQTVDQLFNSIHKSRATKEILRTFFNRGFYSTKTISKDELKGVKTLISEMLKS